MYIWGCVYVHVFMRNLSASYISQKNHNFTPGVITTTHPTKRALAGWHSSPLGRLRGKVPNTQGSYSVDVTLETRLGCKVRCCLGESVRMRMSERMRLPTCVYQLAPWVLPTAGSMCLVSSGVPEAMFMMHLRVVWVCVIIEFWVVLYCYDARLCWQIYVCIKHKCVQIHIRFYYVDWRTTSQSLLWFQAHMMQHTICPCLTLMFIILNKTINKK